MQVMKDILEWLKVNKLDIYQMFNDGASREDLVRLKEAFPSISEEILSFYSLVDGQREESDTFVNGFWVPSIQNLLIYREFWDVNYKKYEIFDEPYGVDTDPAMKNVFWDNGWLPFLMSSDNDFGYLIDFNPTSEGQVGQVIFIDDINRRVVTSSLFEFLERIRQALYEGDYKIKNNDIWLKKNLVYPTKDEKPKKRYFI